MPSARSSPCMVADAVPNVREIDAACLDANTHLAGSRLRIRDFFNNKNLGLASFRNPDLPHGTSLGVGAIDRPRSNASIEFISLVVRPPRGDNRLPEKHSEKSNHNNAKDKAARAENRAGVVVGGQPVGIAHAKLLGRPPASQPHQRLIKIS